MSLSNTKLTGFLSSTLKLRGLLPMACALGLLASPAALADNYQFIDPPGTDGDHTRDLYLPEGEGPFPLVVLVHPGGFVAGDRTDGAVTGWASYLTSQGYAAFSIDYTLATRDLPQPTYLYAHADVKCSVMFARYAADVALDEDWAQVDPDEVVILGSSAGGNLAGWVGARPEQAKATEHCMVDSMRDRSDAVTGTSLISAMADFKAKADAPLPGGLDENETLFLGDVTCDNPDSLGICELSGCDVGMPSRDGVCTRQAPATYIDGDEAPFLLIHGDADEVIPLDVPYVVEDALIDAGVDYDFHACSGLGHGARADDDCNSDLVGEILVDWLDAR